jgi:hypothetical protein
MSAIEQVRRLTYTVYSVGGRGIGRDMGKELLCDSIFFVHSQADSPPVY